MVRDGVGKDNVSDFTTNLIKGFLCEYTQKFAQQYIDGTRTKFVMVPHAEFDYKTRTWIRKRYRLPYIDGDYVLLTPKDILTKDEAWINKHDIIGDFDDILESMQNFELRAKINEYFLRRMPENAKRREINEAIASTLRTFPELIDYYIRLKEDTSDKASSLSNQKVREIETVFIGQVSRLIEGLQDDSAFYATPDDTHEEAYKRVMYLKQAIENNDGYRIFYMKGEPLKRESDLQLMFRLTWFASTDDVNAEVNNGRGPVDYKISRGSKDSTLVEFKLASNSKLKQNLEKQVDVYKAANQTDKSIKVILYFNDTELEKLLMIMKSLDIKEGKDLVLIDARASNKPSGSNAK